MNSHEHSLESGLWCLLSVVGIYVSAVIDCIASNCKAVVLLPDLLKLSLISCNKLGFLASRGTPC